MYTRKYSEQLAILLLLFISFHTIYGQKAGDIAYKPDGLQVAQPYFREGMLLLHQFRFDEAAEQFQMAQLLDPEMYMAYWGEAMCCDQSIWMRHDLKKGQGVLFKLGISTEKRLAKITNALEQDMIRSVELLFDAEKDWSSRHIQYHQAMTGLAGQYPQDMEVQCFFALSALTMYTMTMDKEFAQEAMQVLGHVLEITPDHPGALHYMLHAADHPGRAYKAREASARYTKVVEGYYPGHLVSHHYMCTGQWGPLVEANENAWKLAEEFAEKHSIKIEDIGYHIPWWQVYGLLQSGRFKEAADIIRDVHFYSRYSTSTDLKYHLLMMRAAFLVESDKWSHEIAAIDVPLSGFDVAAKSVSAFSDGLAALHDHNLQRAAWYINKISEYRSLAESSASGMTAHYMCHGKAVNIPVEEPVDRDIAEMLELSLTALHDLQAGNQTAAFEHIERAAGIESRLPYFPAPPLTIKPVHEVYGEMLLDIGRPVDALAKFDVALTKHPNRVHSAIGKYKSLKMKGDQEQASAFRKYIDEILMHADPGYPRLID